MFVAADSVFLGDVDPGRLVMERHERTWHMPPLGEERSDREQLIQVKKLVKNLAGTVIGISYYVGSEDRLEEETESSVALSAADRLLKLADRVPYGHDHPGWSIAWNAFSEDLYKWDAAIQDLLASAAFWESSAYQLGRGLAETSWALDISSSSNSTSSWSYLLGTARCVVLTGLIARLTPVAMTPQVSQAVKGSPARWVKLAKADLSGNPEAPVYLRRQVSLWRDLLLSGADPQSLIPPAAPLQRLATVVPAVKALWLQIFVASGSIALFGYAASLLTAPHPSGVAATVVTSLGVVGITGSGLSAKAKTSATNVLAKVREAVASDLLVEGATVMPDGLRRGLSRYRPGEISAPLGIESMNSEISERVTSPTEPIQVSLQPREGEPYEEPNQRHDELHQPANQPDSEEAIMGDYVNEPLTAEPQGREVWGYAVWGTIALVVIIPELSATFTRQLIWPTISGTVGHLEYLRDWVGLIVVAFIVLVVIQVARFPAGPGLVLNRPPHRFVRQTPGGRCTRRREQGRDISVLILGAGVVVVIVGSTLTAELDPSDRYALGYVLYGLIALFCIATPSVVAYVWAKDVPFPTFFRTLANLERRVHFMSAVVLIGLGILLIHLALYPWPNVFHVLKSPGPTSP
jgi:hypothetical protein